METWIQSHEKICDPELLAFYLYWNEKFTYKFLILLLFFKYKRQSFSKEHCNLYFLNARNVYHI